MKKRSLAAAALLPLVAACSDSTGVADHGTVALRFATAAGTSASLSRSAEGLRLSTGAVDGPLTLSGSNGTLVIDDLRLIVSEFELERQEGSCATASTGSGSEEHGDDDAECDEFSMGPSLVDLPLSGGEVTLGSDVVPAGTYTGMKFKVKDLEEDEDDDAAEGQGLQTILAELRQSYVDFPSDASMVVHGTFTPTGGAAEPFTVYFAAEVEVEKALDPPVVVPGAQALTVTIDPSLWFESGTEVMDLAALDGRTVEFESEMEHGVEKVEHDGHDRHDD